MMEQREVSVSGHTSSGRPAAGSGSSKGRAARRRAVRGPAAKRSARRRSRPAAAARGLSRSKRQRKSASGQAALPFPAGQGSLSVIISARNEEQTLPKLLEQVMRLKPQEIIVVLNGCSDRSFQRTRLCRQATVIYIPESAGHDVGRSVGAKLSRGDLLLFLDGDMVIPAGQLFSFVEAAGRGVDVALNDLDPLLPPFGLSDAVTRCKLYLNQVLGRSDLGASSMTAVPHALSRRALEQIGYRELMVPPKALALSIMGGLRVEKAGMVNVIKHNRLRQGNTGAGNAMEQLIAGDHAEALVWVIAQQRTRGQLSVESLLEHRRQIAAWRNAL
ncbi:glycosyltransferase family 2 protein [Paenibacillus tritici]|uniref:4,4'-diaponeurosporenoate glycosyltransferase n=1 Tax=Paenibacillus tritici TaxID=1873425 RepID=A0ABX2DM94_9BACL|nr:glycosyltransferase family A protein [Paenibacillus tritici]NQX45750.1 glycosyltransferase family 2 protein [Paenibacillus tritici]QUL54003.1 glycosyltransferase family 2 protein [Paenibacillus tritici]